MTFNILSTTLNTLLAAVATLAAGAIVIYVATQAGRRNRSSLNLIDATLQSLRDLSRAEQALTRYAVAPFVEPDVAIADTSLHYTKDRSTVAKITTQGKGQTPPHSPTKAPDHGTHSRAAMRKTIVTAAERRAEMWSVAEKLITSYHDQALFQAKMQFWFSVVAATVGFVFIIYKVVAAQANDAQIVLDVLPGAIIDAVAALYFTQAQETRRRATELYDRLREDNKQDGALDLADSIRDESVCSAVKARLALHLAGIDSPDLAMIVAATKPPPQPDKEENGKRLPSSEANT
jgi:hypothetical protein